LAQVCSSQTAPTIAALPGHACRPSFVKSISVFCVLWRRCNSEQKQLYLLSQSHQSADRNARHESMTSPVLQPSLPESSSAVPLERGSGESGLSTSSASVPHGFGGGEFGTMSSGGLMSSVVDFFSFEQDGGSASHCASPGCTRSPWNGMAGQSCCRTCAQSSGARHGADCERRFNAIAEEAFGTGTVADIDYAILDPPQCTSIGCTRETWNGMAGQTCCRTCAKSSGAAHGPDCDLKLRSRRNLAAAERNGSSDVIDAPLVRVPSSSIVPPVTEFLKQTPSNLSTSRGLRNAGDAYRNGSSDDAPLVRVPSSSIFPPVTEFLKNAPSGNLNASRGLSKRPTRQPVALAGGTDADLEDEEQLGNGGVQQMEEEPVEQMKSELQGLTPNLQVAQHMKSELQGLTPNLQVAWKTSSPFIRRLALAVALLYSVLVVMAVVALLRTQRVLL